MSYKGPIICYQVKINEAIRKSYSPYGMGFTTRNTVAVQHDIIVVWRLKHANLTHHESNYIRDQHGNIIAQKRSL